MAGKALVDEIVDIILSSKRKAEVSRVPLKIDVVYVYCQEVHTAHRSGSRCYKTWFACVKVKNGPRRHVRLKKHEVEQVERDGRLRKLRVEFLTDDEHFRRCLDFRNLVTYRPKKWP